MSNIIIGHAFTITQIPAWERILDISLAILNVRVIIRIVTVPVQKLLSWAHWILIQMHIIYF